MHLSAPRTGGLFALAAATVVVATVPLLFVGRPDSPPPFSHDPVRTLSTLAKGQVPFWSLLHTLYALFFLLLLPTLWSLYVLLKEEAPAEATAALATGGLALVSEGLGRLWHATLESTLAGLLLAQSGPDGREVLLEAARHLDPFHQALHVGGYLIVVWAVLTAWTVVQRRGILPLWAGLLAPLLIPALGPFPWASLPWLVPVGLLLWREEASAPSRPMPRTLVRSRR